MNMLKIVHCVIDDKFIDSMISIMDSVSDSCEHDFVIVSESTKINYVYLKKIDRVKIVLPEVFIRYLDERAANVLVIHGLFSLNLDLLLKIKSKIKVVWLAWGYDIYESIFNYRALIRNCELYHIRTLLVKKMEYLSHPVKVLYDLKHCLDKSLMEEAVGRVDYFSGVIPEEYDMIKSNPQNSFFKAKRLDFSYINLDSYYTKEHLNDSFVEGMNIQIGNSGDETNNHLDLFYLLHKYDLGNKKIFVPLSYSGGKHYKSVVCWYGRRLWKENFIPIMSFMPLNDYNNLIASTQYALFFHERQQAMGNIYNALWNGSMVFLSQESPAYCYLKKNGYVIYTIQNDLYRVGNCETLSYDERMNNRIKMLKFYSPEACLNKTKKIIDILTNDFY